MQPVRFIQTAAALTLVAVFVFLCGCATPLETPVRSPEPFQTAQPYRVAVLPPRVHPDLKPGNLTADMPLGKQLLDGRGLIVTSPSISGDIGLEIVSVLTQAGKYERIFTAADIPDALAHGANALMTVTVWDYRTVLLGSNRNYPLMVLLSPLMSQYWIRWRTIEARLEWEVNVTSVTDESVLCRKRLKRAYTSPVRSASGKHFTSKMLTYLQTQAAPAFIGELFETEAPK